MSRSEVLQIRLTKAEKQRLVELAELAGVPVSELLRQSALGQTGISAPRAPDPTSTPDSSSEAVRRAEVGSGGHVLGDRPGVMSPEKSAEVERLTEELANLPGTSTFEVEPTPTATQLSQRTGMPRVVCERALERGTWRELL